MGLITPRATNSTAVMAEKIFIDTNILVYAHDRDAGEKQIRAARAVKQCWLDQSGVLSLQVLQEAYVTLTQKIKNPLPSETVRSLIQKYGHWEIVLLGVDDLMEAIDLQKKHQLSFWDALIVQAALRTECTRILSEDFSADRRISGLTIKNPFVD